MTRTIARINNLFPKTLFNDLVFSDWDKPAWPAMDTLETEDKYLIHMDVPGVKDEDVSVTYDNGVLTISGHMGQDHSSDTGTVYLRERYRGNFSRSVRFKREINPELVDAVVENGILRRSGDKRTAVYKFAKNR